MKDNKKLQGIGGWLLLPTIGLALGFLYSLNNSFYDIINIIGLSDYIIFLFMRISLTFIMGYTLFLLLNKKKSTIKWFIFIIWFELLLVLFVAWELGDYTPIIPSICSNILWTTYFLKSERVRNTFVKE